MKLPRIYLTQRLFSTRRRSIVIIVGLALAALSVYYTWSVSVNMKHEDEVAISELRNAERNAVEMWRDIISSPNIIRTLSYNADLLNKLADHTDVPIIIADEFINVWITNLPDEVINDE